MIKHIKQTDLNEKAAEDAIKDQRVCDLELALAEQVVNNAELEQRQQDTELMLADILVNGVI